MQISGQIPLLLYTAAQLAFLDVSSNALSGELPYGLARMSLQVAVVCWCGPCVGWGRACALVEAGKVTVIDLFWVPCSLSPTPPPTPPPHPPVH